MKLQEHLLSVTINGSPMDVPSGTTVADLLRILEIDSVLVAVEQNFDIVPKSDFTRREIATGDRIEVVHFVGGG